MKNHVQISADSFFLGYDVHALAFRLLKSIRAGDISLCSSFFPEEVHLVRYTGTKKDPGAYYGAAVIRQDFEDDFRARVVPGSAKGRLGTPNYILYDSIIFLFDWDIKSASPRIYNLYADSGMNPFEQRDGFAVLKALPYRQVSEGLLEQMLLNSGYTAFSESSLHLRMLNERLRGDLDRNR